MSLDRFAESTLIRDFLALQPEQQRLVRVLVRHRVGNAPVHEEAEGPRFHPMRADGLQMIRSGMNAQEVADQCAVSRTTVYRWADQAGLRLVRCRARRQSTPRRTQGGAILRGLRAMRERGE